MRPLRAFAIFALLFQSWSGVAAELITNLISPIVSYQYHNDLYAESRTRGGLVSPVVSYQFLESLSGTSAVSQKSHPVSYYYQPVDANALVMTYGRVTDFGGSPLPGATVSAMVYLTEVMQTLTDANGDYQLPPVGAGVYTLAAFDSTHQTSMRVLTLNPAAAQQNFQLIPALPFAQTQQVHRSPTVNYMASDAMGSLLKVFDGSTFIPVTDDTFVLKDRMTIVMTHGWVKAIPNPAIMATHFNSWPVSMAIALKAEGINPSDVNIFTWDWRYAASAESLWGVGTPADRTQDQGRRLGEQLQHVLGEAYSRPLHFLGHSLGTLLNASTINYLRGNGIGTSLGAPKAWKDNLIHVTLFDQAQLAEHLPTSGSFLSPLPLDFTWADNYKALVACWDLPQAVNINLQKGIVASSATTLDPRKVADDSHGYPIDWYEKSIRFPLDRNNPLGFQRSFEYAAALFPPSDIPKGSLYHQSPVNDDPLALDVVNGGLSSLGLMPDVIVQSGVNKIQYTVGVAVKTADKAEEYALDTFDFVGNVAAKGERTVVNIFDYAASLRFSLTAGPSQLPRLKRNGLPAYSTPELPSSAFPMFWLPIQFPIDALVMAFDYMTSGDPAEDTLVCAVGTNNLFSLPAKYISTNVFSASRLIDVSEWAGTTNELFFGFMGGSSTNSTVTIQNIRFYSLQPPELSIATNGAFAILSWPNTAGGFSLASTTNLTNGEWERVTNFPSILRNNYVVTNVFTDHSRFFRLQQ
jgi:hypothetical protein